MACDSADISGVDFSHSAESVGTDFNDDSFCVAEVSHRFLFYMVNFLLSGLCVNLFFPAEYCSTVWPLPMSLYL